MTPISTAIFINSSWLGGLARKRGSFLGISAIICFSSCFSVSFALNWPSVLACSVISLSVLTLQSEYLKSQSILLILGSIPFKEFLGDLELSLFLVLNSPELIVRFIFVCLGSTYLVALFAIPKFSSRPASRFFELSRTILGSRVCLRSINVALPFFFK